MFQRRPSRTLGAPSGPWRALVVCLFVLAVAGMAVAQVNPVYVDDSPLAREMFAQAMDHAEDNIGEAVRLLQELLDDFPDRLIAAHGAPDQSEDLAPGLQSGGRNLFVTVRTRVLQTLRGTPRLLERYRQHESAHARRLLEAGMYAELAHTRPLTTHGLEAMLRLAQRDIERGRFNAALRWLNEAIEHPDLVDADVMTAENERRAAHAWHMLGLVARYQMTRSLSPDDTPGARTSASDRFERAMEELERIGRNAELLRKHLSQDRRLARSPRKSAGETVFDHTFAAGLEELVAEEIWSLPLEDSLYQRRQRNTAPDRPIMGRSLNQSKMEGHFLTVVPTVRENVAFVNQGHRIQAVDRMSGSPVWERDFIDRPSAAVIDREDQQPRDLNVIAVEGNALVTLTGHAYGTDRSSDGRLIRLDADTGELVWSAKLSELRVGGEMDDLFPHSSPVIVDETVIVLARRVSRQSLSSAYLVAYDLETGEPNWLRHIVSSSSTRRASRAFSTVVVADGEVYISSPIGAAACVDVGTGHVRWLHRFGVGINPHPYEQQQQPWELLAPVVLDERVIIIEPGYSRVAVLDRRTGMVMRTIEMSARSAVGGEPGADQWPHTHYLLHGSRYIIGVGREISAYDPDDLVQPIWRVPREERSAISDRPSADSRQRDNHWADDYEPYGRVQIVSAVDEKAIGHQPTADGGQRAAGSGQVSPSALDARSWLVVPTRGGVRILDEETGIIVVDLPMSSNGGAGNVLANDAQLLVSGNSAMKAYMSLERAEELMRRRLAERGGRDAGPAVALARLGVRVGRLELVSEAVELAMQAIDAVELHRPADRPTREQREAAAHRDELAELLLGAEIDRVAADRGEQEKGLYPRIAIRGREPSLQLFALIERVVRSPEHRARALFKRGGYDRMRDPVTAIEQWQRVLGDDELGRVVLAAEDHGVLMPAWRLAMGEIAAVLVEHGPRVYEAQEEFARMRAEQLIARSTTTPAQLGLLAREFPYSSGAVMAAVEHANRLAARGEIERALDALAEHYRRQSALRSPLSALRSPLSAVRGKPIADSGQPMEGGCESKHSMLSPNGSAALLLERYVELALEHDRPAAALDMLRLAAVRSPLSAVRGKPIADSGQPMEYERPRVGLPRSAGEAGVVEGRLVPLRTAALRSPLSAVRGKPIADSGQRVGLPLPPGDAVLVEVERSGPGGARSKAIVKHHVNGGEFNAQWSAALPGTDARVLLWSDEQILIAFESAGEGMRVMAVSPSDGARLWLTSALGDLGVSRTVDPAFGATRTGRPVHRAAGRGGQGEITPIISHDHLVLVRADGLVAGFDLARGTGAVDERRMRIRQPAWVARRALEHVEHAAMHDGLVILAGAREGGGRGNRQWSLPGVAVLDIRSGEARVESFTPPYAGGEILWMQPISPRTLVYASDEGVTRVSLPGGELVWSNHSAAAADSTRGWVNAMNMAMVIEESGGDLRSLCVATGRLGQPFEVPSHGEWHGSRVEEVQADGDAFIARYPQRFVRYDVAGKVIGADMILDQRADEWLLPADDRFVLISNLTDTGDGRLQFQEMPTVYRVYVLSRNGRLLNEGVDVVLPEELTGIDAAALRDGWLLLSAEDWTIAVPMPRG